MNDDDDDQPTNHHTLQFIASNVDVFPRSCQTAENAQNHFIILLLHSDFSSLRIENRTPLMFINTDDSRSLPPFTNLQLILDTLFKPFN